MDCDEVNTRAITDKYIVIKTQMRTKPISSCLAGQACQYGIYYTIKKVTFLWINSGNAEQVQWAHFACSGSQSQHSIRLILPARHFSHVIIISIADVCQ